MSTKKQLKLSESKVGRIELHILGLFRDHHFKFHLKGIRREFKIA